MGRTHSSYGLGWLFRRAIGVLVTIVISLGLWMVHSHPVWAEDYTKEFLVGVDFSGKDLTDSSFTKANMREVNLSHTDLRGVSFYGANLEGANLEGANLTNATLDAVRFSGANLQNAILEGAFAFSAKFDGVNLDGADLTDLQVRQDTFKQLCAIAKGTNPITHRDTRESLGC